MKKSDEYFYSKSNMEHLNRSIAQLKSGEAKIHDLIEPDDTDYTQIQHEFFDDVSLDYFCDTAVEYCKNKPLH
ncbi:MAG: hypothetical protein ACI4JF_10800 [Oscillospiraceae bacterium]